MTEFLLQKQKLVNFFATWFYLTEAKANLNWLNKLVLH